MSATITPLIGSQFLKTQIISESPEIKSGTPAEGIGAVSISEAPLGSKPMVEAGFEPELSEASLNCNIESNYYFEGKGHYRNEQYSEAEAAYRKGIECDPKQAQLYNGLGEV